MCNGRICRQCTYDGSLQVLVNSTNQLIAIENGRVRPVIVGELTADESEALGKQLIRAASIARGYRFDPASELTPVEQLLS